MNCGHWFFCIFGVAWVMPCSVMELLACWEGSFGKGRIWKTVSLCIMWYKGREMAIALMVTNKIDLVEVLDKDPLWMYFCFQLVLYCGLFRVFGFLTLVFFFFLGVLYVILAIFSFFFVPIWVSLLYISQVQEQHLFFAPFNLILFLKFFFPRCYATKKIYGLMYTYSLYLHRWAVHSCLQPNWCYISGNWRRRW